MIGADPDRSTRISPTDGADAAGELLSSSIADAPAVATDRFAVVVATTIDLEL